MTGKQPYEAYGIRPDGGSFAVEILGHQTEADAIAAGSNETPKFHA